MPGSTANYQLKGVGTRTKRRVFTDPQKGTTLTCCTKLSVGYFKLKLTKNTHSDDNRDLFYIL